MAAMSPLQLLGAAALASYLVLMVFFVKWSLFDDKTDRMAGRGGMPVPPSRDLRVWVFRHRKFAGGLRRLNRRRHLDPGWETPSAEPPP